MVEKIYSNRCNILTLLLHILIHKKCELPASKQYIDRFGRVHPSSGISNFSGNRSLRPYSEKTGFIRNNPP